MMNWCLYQGGHEVSSRVRAHVLSRHVVQRKIKWKTQPFNFRVADPRNEIFSQTFLIPSIDFSSRPWVMNLVSCEMMSWNINPIHKLKVEIGCDESSVIRQYFTTRSHTIMQHFWCSFLVLITMTSLWTRWRLKSPASSRLFTPLSPLIQGADQRKCQSSASLAFVRGIHRGPVNSPHKGPVTQKMFPFDDVIM